jgi:hypothetical protein
MCFTPSGAEDSVPIKGQIISSLKEIGLNLPLGTPIKT